MVLEFESGSIDKEVEDEFGLKGSVDEESSEGFEGGLTPVAKSAASASRPFSRELMIWVRVRHRNWNRNWLMGY